MFLSDQVVMSFARVQQSGSIGGNWCRSGRQRGRRDSRLRKKKGINIKINDKEKSEARRRLTIVVGVGVITTVEMTVVANGVGASEEMNEGRQDEARQS
jgi:hypothetical protein